MITSELCVYVYYKDPNKYIVTFEPIARQRLGKHIPATMNTQAKIR
jgi:hypothetical protein